MGLILSIDTAISVCAVALHKDGEMLSVFELHQENIHAQKLMQLVDTLFVQSGISIKQLNAVAVSRGPGSYTGLRIGVSTAKGIAFGNDIPLIAVDTLDALAYGLLPFADPNDYIIPMVDARRMEVYCKVMNADGKEIKAIAAEIIEDTAFWEYWENRKVFFTGNSNEKVSNVLRHPNCHYVPMSNTINTLGKLAYTKFQNSVFEDLAYFEPNYLKEFRVLKSKKNLLLT